MKIFRQVALMSLVFLGGCAANKIPTYKHIDLSKDLDAQTLGRYQAEMKQVKDSGGSLKLATLEKTSWWPWWPIGIAAFWNRGLVETMPGQNGQIYYNVSRTLGLGPLSAIYVTKEDATYDAKGTLLTNIYINSLGLGHISLYQGVRSRLDSETWVKTWTAHILHHAFSVSDTNGTLGLSLFTAPNPTVAFEYKYANR